MKLLRPALLSSLLLGAAPQTAPPVPGFGGAAGESTTSIRWQWTNVAGETGYALHDGAHVQKATAPADATSVVESGLQENTAYTRHVHALNGAAASAASASQTWYTLVRQLGAADMSLAVLSSTSVRVDVVPPPNATAGSTGCQIIWWNAAGGRWDTIKAFSNVYSFTHSGAAAGADNHYAAIYRNGNAWPNPVYGPTETVRTDAPPPAAPASLAGAAESTASLRWTWLAVAGAAFYDVHVNDAAHTPAVSVAAPTLSVVETGLAENTSYTRHVHARNGNGISAASAPAARATRIRAAGGADFALAAPSGTRVDVTVVVPPNGSTGSTGVRIERSPNGTSSWAVVRDFSNAYTWSDTTVVENTTYHYRIAYRNQEGAETAASAAESVTTSVGASTPTAFKSSADTTTALRHTWGGVTGATGYVIHDAAHVQKGSVAAGVTSFVESGLTENSRHVRHAHAVVGGANGPASGESAAYTRVAEPVATDLSLSVASATRINVTAVAPPNGTSGLTGCEILHLEGGVWMAVKPFSNAYTFAHDGLAPGTSHSYRVRFRNGDGVLTGYSPIKGATTSAAPAPPPAPATFSLTGIDAFTLKSTWSSVAGATGYVLHDEMHRAIAVLPSTATSHTETGLVDNSRYVRHLHALNAGGEGAASATREIWLRIHDPTVDDFFLHPLSTTSVRIDVKPPPNANTGGTSVEISRWNGSAWVVLVNFQKTYTYTDTGLTAGATVQYMIRFSSASSGNIPKYSPVKFVELGTPDAPSNLSGTADTSASIVWSWISSSGGNHLLHDAAEAVKGQTPGTTYRETGLSENQTYTRHVHATHALGTSAASAAAARATRVHEPLAADLSAAVMSLSRIDVSVKPPPQSTAGSTGCEIARSTDGASWTVVKGFSSVYAHADAGLLAGGTYHYRFRYRNRDGLATGWSSALRLVAVPPPVITTASKKVRTPTPRIDGTAAAGLTVAVYVDGLEAGTVAATSGSWSLTLPSRPDGVYRITARARQGAAESADSNPVILTIDRVAPAPPANVRSTPYDSLVDVEWDPSPSTDVAGYLVYRKTGPTGAWALLNTTGVVLGTKYRDATAVNGTAYYYHVKAVDDSVAQ